MTRRELLRAAGSATAAAALYRLAPGASMPDERLLTPEDQKFLRSLAQDTIRVATKQDSTKSGGFPFVTPGGNYPAFWIRDFSMAVGSGLLPAAVVREHLFLLAKCQNGPEERKLKSGARIPPWSIPDHINYDQGAVFYPGTYSSGDDQGGEPFGALPPVDDHYEFVHIAWRLFRQTKDASFLDHQVEGLSLLARLDHALDAPATDPKTGLVVTEQGNRAVGFGFCDTIAVTGSLLFASLLRHRALNEMAELDRAKGRNQEANRRKGQAKVLQDHIEKVFLRKGWLIAATKIGQQPDVWGSAFAVCRGVLTKGVERQVAQTLAEAVRKGTMTYKGAVRHVPTDHDFSPTSAWEQTAGVPKNRYQNGAHWHVPTGWLAVAIAKTDRKLARQVVAEMVEHFRDEDFRRKGVGGAPWECLHPDGDYRQNPVYMASVTLPLETLMAP